MSNLQATINELKKRQEIYKNAGFFGRRKALNDLLYVVDILIKKSEIEEKEIIISTGEKGLSLIKAFEGCRLNAYLCPANVPTIGYGHTKNVSLGMTITQEQANNFLKDDLVSCEQAVNDNVKVPVNQNQFDALVSFVFNLGSGNFMSSTLLRLLNNGEYGKVPNEFLKWVYADGKKLAGLIRRRQAEADLFIS